MWFSAGFARVKAVWLLVAIMRFPGDPTGLAGKAVRYENIDVEK